MWYINQIKTKQLKQTTLDLQNGNNLKNENILTNYAEEFLFRKQQEYSPSIRHISEKFFQTHHSKISHNKSIFFNVRFKWEESNYIRRWVMRKGEW